MTIDPGVAIGIYGAVLATLLALREWRAGRVALTVRAEEPLMNDPVFEVRDGWGHAFEFTVTNEGARPVPIREIGVLIESADQPNLQDAPLDRERRSVAPGEWVKFVRRSNEIVEKLREAWDDTEGGDPHVVGLYVVLASEKRLTYRERADIANYDVQGKVLPSTLAALKWNSINEPDGWDEP